jgi:uncharacterized protein YceK
MMKSTLLVAISMTLLLAGCGSVPATLDETPQAVVLQPAVEAASTMLVRDGMKFDVMGADAPNASCNTSMSVQQCCSDNSCSGKVLSNKDAHNCKNSGGKSWHPASQNGNPTKCSRL